MIESQNRINTIRGFSFYVAVLCLGFVTMMFVSTNILGQARPAERVRVEPDKYDNANESKLGVLGDSEYNKELFEFLNPSNNLITAATYAFSTQTSVALEDMSSGTTQLVAAASDDGASAVTNIGFDFWYDGIRFSQFSCNANGVCRLGATAVGTTFINSLASTTNAPKIAPYFDDMWVGTNGNIRFKVVGSAGSRKLIVEWNNMTIPRQASATTGAGTFQMWLYESSHPTLGGVIQFVYGNGIIINSANSGYSVGLQSGAATNFASVTTSADTVSYATANDTQTNAIDPGKSYLFTPNVPTAPSGLNFTAVAPLSLTANWTDNSANEFGFAVYRSTDGVNFTFAGQAAANATSFNDTGLNHSTNYTYRVYAVTEGALSSPALQGSQMTLPPGNDTCAAAGGNWDAPATWTDGSVPTAGDNVTIGSGCTVTVNVTNAVALNVTVSSGGTLQSPTTGALTDRNLTAGGNVTNNGTLDFSTNGDTSAAILTFGAGGNNVVFGGTGATTDVRSITVAKGAQSTVVELMPTNFTVRGVNSDVAGYLTLTSGTFKISGAFAMTNRTFPGPTYSIPILGGFWLNNPNYTVSATASSTTTLNNGLLRVTNGVYNIGLTGADGMGGGTGAVFNVEGGTINATRIDPQSAVTWTQSAGTVNISPTTGNTRSGFGSFELFSTGSTFNMSGGVVNLVNAAVAATPVDYQVRSGTINYTGGVVNVGTAATATNFNFRFRGNAPSIVIDNTTNAKTLTFTAQTLIRGNVTVNTGTTFDISGFLVATFGSFPTSFVNNGTVTGNTAGSRLYLNSTDPLTVSGTGIFGTSGSPLQSLEFDSAGGVTLNQTAQIITLRVILFTGNVTNSGKITLGDGGATTGVVQIGNTTTPTDAGVFDAPFTFNIGTGGEILTYLRTTNPRSIGPEIVTPRSVTSLTLDDNAVDRTLTLTGGNLTVTGALTLTNGILATLGNILDHNGAAARTNGYVNGNLRRLYSATGAYTYHVGQNGYSPVAANVTATALGGSPSLLVRANDNTLAGLDSATSVSRNWTLIEGNSMTADLSFTYLDADVNGNEADYRLFKLSGGMLSNQCAGGPCVVEATNTASITGVTDFSDWGIGEAGAGAAGVLAFSGPTYMTAENSGPSTIAVNRTGGSGGAVSVAYALTDGTATGGATCAPGIDYVNTGGTVNLASGEMSKTFMVPLCGDSNVEPDETVNMTLSNPMGGATIGTQNTAVLTIQNDDAAAANVNVNPGNINYATLKDAFDAINAGTHTGAVTVDILASTTETDSAVLNSSGAGSASYTSVIIRPAADGVSVSGPIVSGRGLIELNGADNVTIDGDNPNTLSVVGNPINRDLTLQNTAANTTTYAQVIRIALNTTTVTSADNNTFKNLNILGSATGRNVTGVTSTTGSENTTYGILAAGNATGATTAPAAITSISAAGGGATVGTGATATNLTVQNNFVNTAARAVAVQGSATTVFPGLMVEDNLIGNAMGGGADQVYSMGVTVQGSANSVIRGNTVYIESFITTGIRGLDAGGISTVVSGTTFEKNKVLRVQNNNTNTWGAYGININGGDNHVMRNNFVGNVRNDQTTGTGAFSTTFGAHGIRLGGGIGHIVYHNSVHLYGLLPGTTSTNLTSAFTITATARTGVDVRNNIFSNQLTGGNPTGTRHVSIALPSGGTSAMNLTENNNDYFPGTDPNSRMAQVGTVFGTGEYTAANFDPTMTTPAANFRSYSSTLSAAGTNDNASKKVDPLFVSNTDLHIQAGSPMNAMAVNVGVTEDIDGETRETPPDIGADEIATPAPAPNINVSPLTLTSTQAPNTNTNQTLMVGNTGNAVLNWSIFEDSNTPPASLAGPQPPCTVPSDIPWLSVSPTMGMTGPGNTSNVTVTFDSTGLMIGMYNANICVASDDPDMGPGNGTALVVVPVTLNVMSAPGMFTISDTRVPEGDSGTTGAGALITYTGLEAASVDFTTVNGTATAGSDYVATSGTLTFNAPNGNGLATQTVSVTINGDTLKEANEFLFINLSNPVNGTISDGQGSVVIVDNDRAYRSDFDNDKKSDFSVFRPSNNTWYVLQSTNGIPKINVFGASGDIPVPGDYDGDGITDRAYFRPSTGDWNVIQSSGKVLVTQNFGLSGDKPVQGDYDGDGKTDFAVFRPSNGRWYVLQSTAGWAETAFGISTDIPVTGDFDGDARNDLAVYRNGTWYVLRSSNGSVLIANWGNSTDKPVSGDFDGDGRTDLAIYRNGQWWIFDSLAATARVINFGLSTDIPAVADYDGDGTSDVAVFRPADGDWYVLRSSDFLLGGVHWGTNGDIPIPRAYTP